MDASIFISFASQDRKVASTLCKALESRGFKCWLSSRDILPGENFQVAIVRAIRKAKILLLVFTANSNGSEEMTKELALASQEKLIVVPLRIEDVAPSEAFTYEFATRQWIDFFADWEAAIDQLSERLGQALPAETAALAAAQAASRAPPEAKAPVVEAPAPLVTAEAAPVVAPPVARPTPAPAAPATPPLAAKAPPTRTPPPREPPAARVPPAPKAAAPKPERADAPAKGRTGLYAAIAAVVLVLVGLGLAAPSLFGKKDVTKEHLAAMAVAETAKAGTTEAKALSDSDVTAVTAAGRPAVETLPEAAVVEAPVKVKPKKKVAAPTTPVEDIPY